MTSDSTQHIADSPADSAAVRRGWTVALAWIAGAALLRALLSALVPLLPDETYYWEWTRRLQGGYYDHPPGVALLIRMGTLLLGDTQAGVRFGPAFAALLMHGTATVLAWTLGGRGVHGARSAVRAAALVAVLPIATLGLVMATPDAPLFMSAMLALLGVERALAAPVRSARSTAWWTFAGVALGFAFVAKYTAVLLPAGLVFACLLHPALRKRFAEPGPWVASAIALLLFAPVVLWNAESDWISFRFQLDHGFNARSRGNPLTRELELVGGQVGLASPVLFALMAATVWSAVRDGWRVRRESAPTDETTRRFALAVISVTPMLFFATSAWKRTVEANWPALVYPAAIVLLATSRARWARGTPWRTGLAVAALLLATMTVQAWRPILPVPPRRDPIARAHGWQSLAMAMDSARRDAFVGAAPHWVAADRYQDASELAFHLHDQPMVFSLNLGGRANQYDLWPTAYERVRPGDGLVAAFDANPRGDSLAIVVSQWFTDAREGSTVALRRGTGEVAHRKVWLYRDARAVPSPRNAHLRERVR